MLGRTLRPLVPAALAVALLAPAGCGAAQDVQDAARGVDKAADCAQLIGQLTNLDLNPDALARAAGEARDVANQIEERARNVDERDVRNAANDLAAKVDRLANSTPAERQRAIRDVTNSATRLARTCGVSVDQLLQGG